MISGLPQSLRLRHSTFVPGARTGVSSPAEPLHPLLPNATGNPGCLVNGLQLNAGCYMASGLLYGFLLTNGWLTVDWLVTGYVILTGCWLVTDIADWVGFDWYKKKWLADRILLCLLTGYWLADWVLIGVWLASHADIFGGSSWISAPRTVVGED